MDKEIYKQSLALQAMMPKFLQDLKHKSFVNGSEQTQMTTLLKIIKNLQICIPFRAKVDPIKLKIPNYSRIIKKPMDFGTVTKKLNVGNYNPYDQFSSTEEFVSDIRQIFMNAVIFNHPENSSDIYFFAVMASNLFEDLLRVPNKL
jgi:hypothetical protein